MFRSTLLLRLLLASCLFPILAACDEEAVPPRGPDPSTAATLPKGAPADLDAMVLVPAGPAVVGFDEGKEFERPRHRVVLGAFQIDVYEVTNFQYRRFLRETGYPPPPHWIDLDYPWGRDFHPVTNVRWEDAVAYATWAGKRLPTEAEWEKACRGPEGRLYAYGNEFDPKRTNYGCSPAFDTVRVDAFPEGRSPYGCYNMTGNVWEWVGDWFSTTYYEEGQVDPRGPASGTTHVSKGGSWTTMGNACRASFRCGSLPGSCWGYCGFRCARSVVSADTLGPPGREDMILIPAGYFLMGSDNYFLAAPERKIWLDAYRIDRVPVTNRQYQSFCRAAGHTPPPHWHNRRFAEGLDTHPVTNVTLEDARAYARWAGKGLPTEAQWEKAARGTDGREYPWGEDYDETRCNTIFSRIGHTVPVGTYPQGASVYGVLGMCGNIWEWVEGRWDPTWYAEMDERNPNGARPEGRHVLRGGTWSTVPNTCRTYCRCQALRGSRWGYCGFRCVVDARATKEESAAPR